jgi:hypothetical protein
MPIAKEAGTSDDSARRPLDRHLRYNAHKYTRLRLATDWGGVVTVLYCAMGGWRGEGKQ